MKMKKIKFIVMLLVVSQLTLFTSCDKDFEEVNSNPNVPVAVPSDLLLAAVLRNVGNTNQDYFLAGEVGSCWVQHLGKPVYNTNELYIPRQNSIENFWTRLYSQVLKEADLMYKLAGEEDNSDMQGVALVIKAHGFQILTDAFGDIPFTEALLADTTGNITPVYDDSQTVIYPGIIALLNEAIPLLNGSGSIDASQDLMYGGDAAKWKMFANSLKFRVMMRAGMTSGFPSAGSMFASNDDEAKIVFLPAAPNANPFFEGLIDGGRDSEWCLGEELVTYMIDTNDPRLAVYAQEVGGNGSGNGYVGKPAGIQDIGSSFFGDANNVSLIGEKYLEATQPAYIMSFAQLNLLMAEAAENGYIGGDAATYFNAGLAASSAANGISATPSITYSGGSDGLEQIAKQSWVALYQQGHEAWAEWLRTGIPALPLAQDAVEPAIPTRLNYPVSQQSVNGVNYTAAVADQGTDGLVTPLWWQN